MFKQSSWLVIALCLLATSVSNADLIDGEELVDPTAPFRVSESGADAFVEDLIRNVAPSSYDLSFVRAGGETPMAVINQQQLTLGDVIGGAELIAIDRGGVTLRINNEEQRISLYGVSVKSNAVSQ